MSRYHLLGTAETPKEIARALNVRREQLGLTLSELNDACGFADRYLGKIFAENYRKHFGEQSMPATLAALGCKIVVVLDEEAELPPVIRRAIEERTHGAGGIGRLKPRSIVAA